MSDSLYNSQGVVNEIDWQQYIPLVRHEALKLTIRLPSTVELDDLLQVGYIGLLDALERFDPNQCTAFSTYATQRIKGAMLDELRSRDWLPRQARQNIKKVAKAITELEHKLARAPTELEIARYLEISIEEYRKILLDSNSCHLCSYDEMKRKLGDGIDLIIKQQEDNNPASMILTEEIRNKIIQQINHLPENEKMVLILYYQEDFNLKEIGKVINISESRVSQLHSQAIKRIKSKIFV